MNAGENARSRALDWAEKWLRDGIDLSRPPAFFQLLQVDMTNPEALIERARDAGARVTYAAVIVRAAALALQANPDLHVLVCGARVYSPQLVDIAISVASDTFLTPVVVLNAANTKSLVELSRELAASVDQAKAENEKLLNGLRRWGWLLPLAILRKAMLKCLHRSVNFRRKSAGTFQVSIVPGVDQFLTPIFAGSAVLTAGRIADRVIAVEGSATIRRTVFIACAADHRVWNGGGAEKFLLAVKELLESSDLEKEPAPAVHAKTD